MADEVTSAMNSETKTVAESICAPSTTVVLEDCVTDRTSPG